jgi:hypothetical protein
MEENNAAIGNGGILRFLLFQKKMNETFLYYIYRRPKIKWQQSGILYRVILKVVQIF